MNDYATIARGIRIDVVNMLHRANGSFGGSAMSCVDLIAVLFHGFMRFDAENPNDPTRDMFILSKGHASSALYAGLASVGVIDRGELDTYGMNDTKMIIHPKRGTYPFIEASTGALGHGICQAVGSALAARILKCDANVFVLMGDGECNEGSVWENAAFASRQKLNNLTVIVDRNRLQGCGRDADVLNYGDMGEKFRAFGFHVLDIDGHDYEAIDDALRVATSRSFDQPTAIIASTVKGRGVSFMEDQLIWHYKSPNDELLKTALEELGL
jgi:transketolase